MEVRDRRDVPRERNEPYVDMIDDTWGDALRPDDAVPPPRAEWLVVDDHSGLTHRVLLLRGLLAPEECAALRARAEAIGYRPSGYRPSIRDCDRIPVHSPDLGARLWRRAGPIIAADEGPHAPNQLPLGRPYLTRELSNAAFGHGREGLWEPIGLNEGFRCCRYEPGGHFGPHCDGVFERSTHETSLLTFMVYLTNNPAPVIPPERDSKRGGSGGGSGRGGAEAEQEEEKPEEKPEEKADPLASRGLPISASSFHNATRFLRMDSARTLAHREKGTGRFLAPDDTVVHAVFPEEGMAIVFFQGLVLHDGGRVVGGEKVILRSDVMFRRVPGSYDADRDASLEEEQTLLRQAGFAEARGDIKQALELYQEAERTRKRRERREREGRRPDENDEGAGDEDDAKAAEGGESGGSGGGEEGKGSGGEEEYV